jgi:hypothetical protein
VIGEAPSRHLHYYSGYHTLTQNRAGDIIFDCDDPYKIHIYASNENHWVDFLEDERQVKYDYYIGTLNILQPILQASLAAHNTSLEIVLWLTV